MASGRYAGGIVGADDGDCPRSSSLSHTFTCDTWHMLLLSAPDGVDVPYGHWISAEKPSDVPLGQKYPTAHLLRVLCTPFVSRVQ